MKYKIFSIFILLFFLPLFVFAKDVHVKGYYRENGTYVRPHIRSAPDSYKHNNYGPSKSDYELMNPSVRDYDQDQIPNYLDEDSDNGGIIDDRDRNPYGYSNPYRLRKGKKK